MTKKNTEKGGEEQEDETEDTEEPVVRYAKSGFPPRDVLLPLVKETLEKFSGFVLTIRQLYYQLVSVQAFPNTVRSYKNLINALSEWRKAGLIPYEAFEDRSRTMHRFDKGERADDPMGWAYGYMNAGYMEARRYRLARWYGQPKRVIVGVEKQAQEQIFSQICENFAVDLVIVKGYSSLSYLQTVAESMKDEENDDRDVVVLYFGDHDPSGQDIPRSFAENLNALFGVDFEIERIALNPDQVRRYKPLPAPVKRKDSRAKKFVSEFGTSVYELDSLNPNITQSLIRSAIEAHFDRRIEAEREDLERKGRAKIERLFKNHKMADMMKTLEEGADNANDDEEE